MTDEEKKAQRAEKARRWRAEHPGNDKRTADDRREQKRAWNAANREKLSAQHRAYMQAHPEQRKKRDANVNEWRRANRERHAANMRNWKRKNPERARVIARKTNLKSKYGITPEEFDELLAEQDGRCAICRTNDPGGHTRRKGERGEFHVDHDHNTGKRRGLLCRKCNAGIGQLGDSIDRLTAALEYLKRFT